MSKPGRSGRSAACSSRRAELADCSPDPGTFELDLDAVDRVTAQAAEDGREFVGTFHSHILSLAEPGEADIEGVLGELMLILDTDLRETRLWRILDGQATEEAFVLV